WRSWPLFVACGLYPLVHEPLPHHAPDDAGPQVVPDRREGTPVEGLPGGRRHEAVRQIVVVIRSPVLRPPAHVARDKSFEKPPEVANVSLPAAAHGAYSGC